MKNKFRPLLLAVGATLFIAQAFAAEFDQRLSNLSTRTQVGSGANVAVVGFVIGPGGAKNILIRAAGPTLGAAPFSVPGAISNPQIALFNAANVQILANDDWSATTVGGANTFSSVGAFAFNTGSRDAALLATNLAPGNYTAQVSGVGTASGIALVEVYDVTGSARLMNLSTRAQVGTGAGILISGLVIAPGGGARKILVRAAGPTLGLPTSQGGFNVPGILVDPAIAVLDGTNTQIASNDNWGSVNSAALSAAFTAAGAFPFAAGSRDAALIMDLLPGNYTIQVSGVGATSGVALIEVYDLTPVTGVTASVTATTASTDTKGAAPGVYTFSRTGTATAPLTVYYTLSGSAISGVDFASLPGFVTIPAGAISTTASLAALAGSASATINKDVTLTLTSGTGYSVGTNGSASVTIFYNPGSLYITSLRAPSTAAASTAFGTATVQLSSDNTFASVNVSFSNLSSPETVAYLRIGNPGDVGIEVLRLVNGQVNGAIWVFQPSGALTAADLVQALKDGRIFLSIESATYPAGELKGSFIQSSGSLTFNPPGPAPALADQPLTAPEAARFLTQATFGPGKSDIDALAGKRLVDLNNWITAQAALPASSHLAATQADFLAFNASGDNANFSYQNRQAAWWKLAVTAPDQLRQRVAFALSEILVTSDVNGTLFQTPLGMANYYDLLVNGAFGNFRTLLNDVTLSPIMGVYLSALRNTKATISEKGVVLTSADENYAREVMQLFTIGLNQLQPDGTLKLDPTGLPIPTYDQTTISQTAKVFTGWAFLSGDATSAANFRGSTADYLHPMMLYPGSHDDTVKTIVGGTIVPANQGGAADLKQTLDALFNHPNTAPFISRELIQRLVTSNPSPGYIYRVAQKFADNGSGVRGDLAAVVRAILTDYEARSAAVAATASFGKLKEPVLRASALLRAFNGASNKGRYEFFVNQNAESQLGQTPFHSPTVFNFFEPNFIQPGTLAAAGLYAPEYQIVTDTTAISAPNQLWTYIYANRSATNTLDATVGIQLDSLLPLARTPAALIDQVNLILAAGTLPKTVTDRLVTAITAMPIGTGTTFNTANDIERVRSAIYLTVSIPQGAIQK